MNRYILYWLLILLIGVILILSSCGQKQWRTRGLKKGWIDTSTIKNDFGITPDTNAGKPALNHIGNSIDSIVKNDEGVNLKPETIEKIKDKIEKEFVPEYLPAVYPDTVLSFPDGSKIRIWFENGILKGALVYQKTDIKELPKTWWENYRDWIYGFFALLILFLLAIRRK